MDVKGYFAYISWTDLLWTKN